MGRSIHKAQHPPPPRSPVFVLFYPSLIRTMSAKRQSGRNRDRILKRKFSKAPSLLALKLLTNSDCVFAELARNRRILIVAGAGISASAGCKSPKYCHSASTDFLECLALQTGRQRIRDSSLEIYLTLRSIVMTFSLPNSTTACAVRPIK